MTAPKARRTGISYTRFSDPKQQKGDSEDRQERMFRDFCQRHDLTPVKEVFADRGRSGYKDEHRKKGRLGQLIAMAKDGRFEPGTVVVVEAWDRLGRLRPDRQTELVAELLRTGVSVGVCQLNDLFTEDDFGTHKWTTLAVFIQLAYQESKQKAERVAESWKRRRAKAREGGPLNVALLSGNLPRWLEVKAGGPQVVPERAAAVRRVFALAAAGYGHSRIVGALTREGVPAFGDSGSWTRPYVAMILNDRRALGEVQPRKGGRGPEGAPIAGLLPAVITPEEYDLARAGNQAARERQKTAGRQGRHVNAFRGLLAHARDGEGLRLMNRGTEVKPELSLINGAGEEGRARRYTFPYLVFEEALLSLLREVSAASVLPAPETSPSRADALRARLASVRRDLGGLKESLRSGYSKALDAVLREKEAEEELLAGELQDELAKAARPAERAWSELPALVDVLRSAPDPDDVRLRLRVVLQSVIERISVLVVPRPRPGRPQGSVRLVAVQVHFAGGKARRDYLIHYRAAVGRRRAAWWARSLADAVRPGDLDLRKRADAAELERALLRLDLASVTGE